MNTFKKLAFILTSLWLLAITPQALAETKVCVSPNDFGIGGTYTVYANPDEMNEDKSDLLRVEPRSLQLGPWVATDLTTIGENVSSYSQNRNKLRIYVDGQWYPWGKSPALPLCTMIPCVPGKDAFCLSTGEKLSLDFANEKAPCYLTSGYGLYALISMDGTNPNTVEYTNSVPTNHFRTFHLKTTGQNTYGKFIDVDFTEVCDENSNCVKDMYGGQPYIPKGKIYLKILDTHYQDDDGGYVVRVVSGVYGSKGFIQEAIETFQKTIQQVTEAIYNGILQSNFIVIVKALLLLYIVVTALMFSMGMMRQGQQELLIRLLKIGIIMTLISPGSWEFFNNSLFKIFTEGSMEISRVILEEVIYNNEEALPFPLPPNANALSVMDVLVKMVISSAVWYKILTLLFSKYFLYFFGMIIALFFILFGIVRIVMLYVIAFFSIAIMLAVAPIFFLMMLFKITGQIFDDWLKQLVSASIMIIIVAVLSALLILMVVDSFMALLSYGSCWDVLWQAKIFSIVIFTIKWWIPQQDLDPFMNFSNYGYFLVIALLYHNVVGYIPQLVDALAGAARQPISAAYNNFAGRAQMLYRGSIAKLIGGATSYVPHKIGDAADKAFKAKTGSKVGIFEGIGKVTGGFSKTVDRFERGFEEKFGASDAFSRTDLRGNSIDNTADKLLQGGSQFISKKTGGLFDD